MGRGGLWFEVSGRDRAATAGRLRGNKFDGEAGRGEGGGEGGGVLTKEVFCKRY